MTRFHTDNFTRQSIIGCIFFFILTFDDETIDEKQTIFSKTKKTRRFPISKTVPLTKR